MCPERDGAEFELDALANQQPVQLPPKLSGTGTTRRLCYHTSERVLGTLKTVKVVLRRTIEQTVTEIMTTAIHVLCSNRPLGSGRNDAVVLTKHLAKCVYFAAILRPFGEGRQTFAGQRAK